MSTEFSKYFLKRENSYNISVQKSVTCVTLRTYITCIRSILEYGSPVFHRALPSYLSEDLERLQKRAMKIIYPELSYAKALELSGLPTLYDRRESIAAKLFDEICANQSHSLHKLLPSRYQPSYYLREKRTFIRPKCKTERCKNSFLLSFVYSS